MNVAEIESDPRAKHPILLPLFAVLVVTVLAGVLVNRVGHDPRDVDATTVLPFGN